MERNAAAAPAIKKGKSVEDIYQKKTQLEHILLRPDTYIGSVEKLSQPMMVIAPDAAGEPSMQLKSISFVPGLFKIFDELVGIKAELSRSLASQRGGSQDSRPKHGLPQDYN